MSRPDHSAAASVATLASPVGLGRLRLRNRVAVAPMTRVSASADGLPSARMADYYRAFAQGGFGLVITEGLYTDRAHAQGYLHQPGLSDNAQAQAWRALVAAVRGDGAAMVAQLMHAGALSQGNPHRRHNVAPTRLRPAGQQMAFYRGSGPYDVPAQITIGQIDEAIAGFAQAARHACEAGFDGVEIHGANGYLLDQFLTEGINQRSDRYGGSVRQRLTLITEVIQAVRAQVGASFTVGLRISQGKVNDFGHKWRGGVDEAADIFGTLGALPLDYLHTTEFEAWQPAFDDGGPSLAALATRHAGLPVIANGGLHDPAQAAGMIARGEAQMVSLGRGALTHADWPARVAASLPLQAFDRAMLSPIADLDNADRHLAARTQAPH